MKVDLLPFAAAFFKMPPEILAVEHRGVHFLYSQDLIDSCERRFGRNQAGIPMIYAFPGLIPCYTYCVQPVHTDVQPPEECYRIHLCTPDPEGRSI